MKTVQIGRVDGDLQQVTVEDNVTMSGVLQQAGLNIRSTERLISHTADAIDSGELPSEGGIYYIADNDVSGM